MAAETSSVSSEGVLVRRWVRYGHDRLYVTAPAGRKIGFWDNKTSMRHPATPADEQALSAALIGYWSSQGQPVPQAALNHTQAPESAAVAGVVAADEPTAAPGIEAQPEQEPLVGPQPAERAAEPGAEPEPEAKSADLSEGGGPVAAVEHWTDLATNKAGAAARERARAKRAEEPVKTLVARVLGVKTDERAWRIGADGEERVAKMLTRLGPEWRVLHAVPVGSRGSDIDHVLMGPCGVYTINTKNHPEGTIWVGGNAVMVNGTRTQYVRNSRFEARRAARLLTDALGWPVAVTGLLVFVATPDQFKVKTQPPGGDVVAVRRRTMNDWLLCRGRVLTADQVDEVFEVARRSSTWTG